MELQLLKDRMLFVNQFIDWVLDSTWAFGLFIEQFGSFLMRKFLWQKIDMFVCMSDGTNGLLRSQQNLDVWIAFHYSFEQLFEPLIVFFQ